jgi:archaellum component FlaC
MSRAVEMTSIRNTLGLELAAQKKKIREQKEEIHKLRESIKDYKTIVADAKRKGFTDTNRVKTATKVAKDKAD